jgi:hypothetical protein
MKRIFFTLSVLILVSIGILHSACGNMTSSNSPESTKVNEPGNPEYPVELVIGNVDTGDNGILILRDGFFPLGWSSSGLFAYINIAPDEAEGAKHVYLIVQDLITDKKKCTEELGSYSYLDDGKDENKVIIKTVWSQHKQKIEKYLEGYKITRTHDWSLSELPYFYNGKRYDCTLSNQTGRHSYFDQKCITSSNITLFVDDTKVLKIFSENYVRNNTDDSGCPYSNKIAGYLKSPFSNQLAVIYVEQHFGFEGIPHVQNIRLVGCLIR